MNQWNMVKKQEDIEKLLTAYGGFHDSCIRDLFYTSGAYVTGDNSMCFGEQTDRKLNIVFQRQWDPVTVELCFSGLRRMNLVGWLNNYSCDIFDCYLAFHSDLIAGMDEGLIVWADTDGFDVKNLEANNMLSEPMTSFVIADDLKWRFIEK